MQKTNEETQKNLPQPFIKEIEIKTIIDEYTETDFLGEYTDDADDWHICRTCGQYLFHATRYDRLLDTLQARIDELEYECEFIENSSGDVAEQILAEYNPERIIDHLAHAIKDIECNLTHDCPHDWRTLKYFIPYAGGEKPGTREYIRYGLQDFSRMGKLNAGDWHFIGIRAESTVYREIHAGHYRVENMTSGGLYGIESDSEKDYLLEIAREELSDLFDHLSAFNVNLSSWNELEKEALETFEDE